MSTPSIAWPKKGIKAFASADGGKFFHRQSILLALRISSPHAEAFKTAADTIIDSHESAKRGPHRDSLLLPVAYLYRHCLELKLKDLVCLGIPWGFFQKAKVQTILDDHNLAKLWTQVKKLLKHAYPKDEPQLLQCVESVVNQFHEADPTGQAFRYERDKATGKQHRHDKLPDHVSLASLRNGMDAVYNFLDACQEGMLAAMDNWDGYA